MQLLPAHVLQNISGGDSPQCSCSEPNDGYNLSYIWRNMNISVMFFLAIAVYQRKDPLDAILIGWSVGAIYSTASCFIHELDIVIPWSSKQNEANNATSHS